MPRGLPAAAALALLITAPLAAQEAAPGLEAVSDGWTSRCASAARGGEMSCEAESRVRLREGGQQLLRLAVQQGPDLAEPPGLLLQLPHGLHIPAGARLSVDGGIPLVLEIQTCDAAGCYAGVPLDETLAAQMRAGGQATVAFQNLAREEITVPAPLAGFGEVLDAIR